MDAKWISAKEFAELEPIDLFGKELGTKNQPDRTMCNKHIWYKKEFEYTGGKYTIDISADDYYKLYINGEFVGMGPSPSYYFCYNYNTFDITRFLQEGKNELRIHTYYQGLCNRIFDSGDLRQGLWARVFKDGEIILATDESFEYAYDKRFLEDAHTLGYETQYVENIDANKSEFVWQPAVLKKYVDYVMQPQISETCIQWDAYPAKITKLADDVYLFDFGKEIAGCLKIKGHAKGNGKIEIMYAEELDENGHARFDMRCMEKNFESWILNGKDDVEAFDYRAFRYVEIKGDVDPDSVMVLRRGYPLKNEYKFENKNKTLCDIFEICKRGVLVSTQETFMDCPTREKGQYLGDMAITAVSHCYISGDTTMFKKALIDFSKSTHICKGLMCCVPGNFMQEIADYSLVYPYEVYKYYELSKDIQTVKELMPTVMGMIDYFKAYERPDGLLEEVAEKWNLVDWPENLRDDYDFNLTKPIGKGCHNVINAFYYGALKYTEMLCELIGEPADLGSERIKAAYNKAFFDKESGLYVDSEGSIHSALHSISLPLFFGIAENADPLAELIMKKGLSCGVYFSFFVLKGLVNYGKKQEALELILNDSEHSWVNMLREQATTCFEAWGKDQKWNTSLCHPWASAPIILLIEDLADII